MAPLREDVLVEDVARAKADSDFVVVSCHWGSKHIIPINSAAFRRGSNSCRRQPRVGASSHMSCRALHSAIAGLRHTLGNFIFDQRQPGTGQRHTAFYDIKDRTTPIRRAHHQVDVLPCYIVDCQPILLAGDARRRALLEMSKVPALPW